MNQLEELKKYLDKMGVPYKVTDKSGKLDYVDASDGESTATYTKEIEVSVLNVVYYIPDLEGFVDPTDDTSGGDYNLFVMDAWETARYMGSLYFNEDPEETEKRLNESKGRSTMKKFNCSMQKKMEAFKKKSPIDTVKSYLDKLGIPFEIKNEVTPLQYKEKFGKRDDVITTESTTTISVAGNTLYYVPEYNEFILEEDIKANAVVPYSPWDVVCLAAYSYLDGTPEEINQTLLDLKKRKPAESLAKKSEKRTVTKSYDVYTYDELSDEAKEKVKQMFLEWRGEDGDIFKEDCENSLAEMFPNSDLKVQYSLTYSQGDGFNTYGTLSIKDLLNADFSKYPLNGSGITALANKDAILAACDKADVHDIDLEENRRYGYSLADRLEVVPNDDENLTTEDTALLSDLENYAREVMEAINSKFEKNGYDYFYEMSDEEVKDMADANEYEFTEDGELA